VSIEKKRKADKARSYGKYVKEMYKPTVSESKQAELNLLKEKVDNQNKALV